MPYRINQDISRPVPGGRSQKSKGIRNAYPPGGSTTANVGSKRGIVGSGTVDRHNRTPAQQTKSAPGNFGGGYAYRDGRLPPNAKRRG